MKSLSLAHNILNPASKSKVWRSLGGSLSSSRSLTIFKTLLLFLFSLSLGLPRGGRWDLYQPLAMAERSFAYWSSDKPLELHPSTPYPPLTTWIIRLALQLGIESEITLLVGASIAVAIVPLLLARVGMAVGLSMRFGNQVVLFGFASMFFLYPWVWYGAEAKPDSLALCLFLTGFLFSTSQKRALNLMTFLPICLALLGKQQIIAPIAALAIAFGYQLSVGGKKAQGWSLASLLFGTALAVGILIGTEGFIDFGVLTHGGRSLIFQLDEGHARVLPLTAILVLSIGRYLFQRTQNRQAHHLGALDTYLLAGTAWLVAGTLSWLNPGGNSGNLAVGMVLLLPFLATIGLARKQIVALVLLSLEILYFAFAAVRNDVLGKTEERLQGLANITSQVNNLSGTLVIRSDDYMAARGFEGNLIALDTWKMVKGGLHAASVPEDLGALLRDTSATHLLCKDSCAPDEEEVRTPLDEGQLSVLGIYGDYTLYEVTKSEGSDLSF